jgi:hypothetical protein
MMKGFNCGNLFFVIVVLFWFSQYIYVPFFSPYLVTLGVIGTLCYDHIGMRALFMISVCAVATAFALLLLTPFRKRPKVGQAP